LPYQSLDADGIILDVNRKWLDRFGHARDEVVGRWFGDFLSEESRALFERRFASFIEAGCARNIEFDLVAADGSSISTLFSGTAEYDADGRFLRTHCLINDVTRLRETERRLREQEALLRAILERSPDIVFTIDLPSRTTDFFNRDSFCGYSKGELEGPGSVLFAVHPEDADAVAGHWQQLTRAIDGEPGSIEYRLRSKDGRWEWIHSREVVIARGPDERPTKLLVTLTVTTAQKHAEAVLVDERDKAQQYLDVAGVMFVVIGPDQRIQLINRRGCEILGYEEERLIGVNWFDTVIRAEDRDAVKDVFDRLIGGEIEPVEHFENTVVTADDSERLIAWHNTVLRNEAGTIVGTLSSGEDITERKEAEERLRESAELLRDLRTRVEQAAEEERRRIARELHDQVSQNLTALSINVSAAARGLPKSPEELHQRLKESERLIEETAGQIRDLTFDLRPPVLDDFGLIAAIEWHAERFASQTGLAIEVAGEEPEPRLSASAELALFRVIQEALTNTAKHARATGVAVRLEAETQRTSLIIEDDGVGFGSTTIPTATSGGWGLLNMRERAEALGGTLTVVPTDKRGARIVVEIPR